MTTPDPPPDSETDPSWESDCHFAHDYENDPDFVAAANDPEMLARVERATALVDNALAPFRSIVHDEIFVLLRADLLMRLLLTEDGERSLEQLRPRLPPEQSAELPRDNVGSSAVAPAPTKKASGSRE
jgi:hypothetical protein